ncbi:MAG: MFS transporter [Clostridia bacterium]|nr:MFS transporter [Clostridia bacterium]
MFSILLALIYLSFISLGLPDSLLGSAWPLMVSEFAVPVSYAGMVSMIISAGTIVSSLLSDRLTRKLGAGLVTAISVLMTAGALLGFALSGSFVVLCILAIPYGLGAGAVDAALNNYVALHLTSKHMSWLHCFWGVGASVSPYIMGWAIGAGHGWRTGYGIVSVIQMLLTFLLFVTLPLWKKKQVRDAQTEVAEAPLGLRGAVRIRGVKAILLCFFAYCAFESTAGLWASTYLVQSRGIDSQTAATFASLFYLGITVGRFLCGFIADRLGDRVMIRCGVIVMLVGVVLILLPVGVSVTALIGLIVAGIGGAPVYPSIIHSTPSNFGKENSHAIVGIQMASAYTGSTLMPPVFGLIAEHINIALFPCYLAVFVLLMLVMSETVNRAMNVRKVNG